MQTDRFVSIGREWEWIGPLKTKYNAEENVFLSSYIEKALAYMIHFPVWYLEEPNFREIDVKQHKPSKEN